MQRLVRLMSGVSFAFAIGLSATLHASAAPNNGGTMIEYDKNFAPMVWYAQIRTILRNLPVSY